jgi:hypothetical protein
MGEEATRAGVRLGLGHGSSGRQERRTRDRGVGAGQPVCRPPPSRLCLCGQHGQHSSVTNVRDSAREPISIFEAVLLLPCVPMQIAACTVLRCCLPEPTDSRRAASPLRAVSSASGISCAAPSPCSCIIRRAASGEAASSTGEVGGQARAAAGWPCRVPRARLPHVRGAGSWLAARADRRHWRRACRASPGRCPPVSLPLPLPCLSAACPPLLPSPASPSLLPVSFRLKTRPAHHGEHHSRKRCRTCATTPHMPHAAHSRRQRGGQERRSVDVGRSSARHALRAAPHTCCRTGRRHADLLRTVRLRRRSIGAPSRVTLDEAAQRTEGWRTVARTPPSGPEAPALASRRRRVVLKCQRRRWRRGRPVVGQWQHAAMRRRSSQRGCSPAACRSACRAVTPEEGRTAGLLSDRTSSETADSDRDRWHEQRHDVVPSCGPLALCGPC